jgi:hypothetical protein
MDLADAVLDLLRSKGEERTAAQRIERVAVKVLDDHIKQHGCKIPD